MAREFNPVEESSVERTGVRRLSAVSTQPIARIRRRFGGFDLPASLGGMLAALGLLVLAGALVAAIVGAVNYHTGFNGIETGWSYIGGLLALFASFLVGGWAAGRIARYGGRLNGLMTAVLTVLLAGIFAAIGVANSSYDLFASAGLPQWFTSGATSATAILTDLAGIAAMLTGGAIGGMLGETYHRRVDRALVQAETEVDTEVVEKSEMEERTAA